MILIKGILICSISHTFCLEGDRKLHVLTLYFMAVGRTA